MKFNKNFLQTFSIIAFLSGLIFTACKKEDSLVMPASSQRLSLYLTDDPSMFDSVFIDIKAVEVKVDTFENHKRDDHFGDNDNDRDDDHKSRDEFGKWDTLQIHPGVYNVSKLRNGIDTLMGTVTINGTIRKIRITLGSNNSLRMAGVSYPLNLLPGINDYLYVKVNGNHHQEAVFGQSSLWIDFDISRSIISRGGQYYLKPVLRPFCDKNFARVKGNVLPFVAAPLVTVYNNTDTANAIPHPNGDFKIRGLKEGVYNVLYKGSNGYRDTTLFNIQIQKDGEKILPNVVLTK
ncbi:MAG: DUF4382 domain-containing protein [Chitinophagia bacterium]|nr:DUF4382 domain-containing protein [Chitinophagia bacterium]